MESLYGAATATATADDDDDLTGGKQRNVSLTGRKDGEDKTGRENNGGNR